MDLRELKSITSSPPEAEKFLRGKNCLRKIPPDCPTCSRPMTLVKYGKSQIWRCPSHKSEKMSIRAGSFWEKSSLELEKLLEILYFWSLEMPVRKLVEVTGVSKKTIILWCQKFREVCSQWIVKNPDKIGKRGERVKKNDALVTKCKKWDKWESHLDEFVWREIHGSSCKDTFNNILDQIAEWYPTP